MGCRSSGRPLRVSGTAALDPKRTLAGSVPNPLPPWVAAGQKKKGSPGRSGEPEVTLQGTLREEGAGASDTRRREAASPLFRGWQASGHAARLEKPATLA